MMTSDSQVPSCRYYCVHLCEIMNLLIYFLIGVTSVYAQSSTVSVASCGTLVALNNNVSEGNLIQLKFAIQPGKQIIQWQKKTQSTYVDIQKNDVYDYTSNSEGTSHVLYILAGRSRYTDSGNYRVTCSSNAFSNVVHVNIVPLPPSTPQFKFTEDTNECKNCLVGRTDKELLVSCYTDGGSEPLNFNMYKNGSRLEGLHIFNQTLGATKRTNLRYNFTPVISDIDTVFKCTVKSPATSVDLSAEATLCIFKPPTRIEVPIITVLRENQSSEVQCQTHEGRPPLQPTFLFGPELTNTSQMTITATGRTFKVLSSFTRSFTRYENNMGVSCCVKHFGNLQCSELQRVRVLFPPVEINLTEEENYNKENGDTQLSLNCTVGASNPGVNVDWQGVKDIPGTTIEDVFAEDQQTNSSTRSVDFLEGESCWPTTYGLPFKPDKCNRAVTACKLLHNLYCDQGIPVPEGNYTDEGRKCHD